MAVISTKSLMSAHPQSPPIGPLDLNIDIGELMVIVGPNGAGKSTLLKTLAGLLPPHSGDVQRFVQTTYLSQSNQIHWPLPVREVLQLSGMDLETAQNAAMITNLGIDHILDKYTNEISHGQLARVRLCRSLISPGLVHFLDEPFAALDPPDRSEIFSSLRKLCDQGHTIVMTSHDLELCYMFANSFLGVNRDNALKASPKMDADFLSWVFHQRVRVHKVQEQIMLKWEQRG